MKKRKRNRKYGFDYASNNIYFVTICIQNKNEFFGHIENEEMILNDFGKIVAQKIEWLERKYPYCEIHNYAVTSNHIHILFEINSVKANEIKIKSVSSLIGALKTTSSKDIHLARNGDFKWQRSFHDHIVKNQQRYDLIFNYINENPKRWKSDILNPQTPKGQIVSLTDIQ